MSRATDLLADTNWKIAQARLEAEKQRRELHRALGDPRALREYITRDAAETVIGVCQYPAPMGDPERFNWIHEMMLNDAAFHARVNAVTDLIFSYVSSVLDRC